MANRFHTHEKVRQQVLAALDLELAKLKETIRSTDTQIDGLADVGEQLDKLHQLRHTRLSLFDEDQGSGYRLQQPSATWNME